MDSRLNVTTHHAREVAVTNFCNDYFFPWFEPHFQEQQLIDTTE